MQKLTPCVAVYSEYTLCEHSQQWHRCIIHRAEVMSVNIPEYGEVIRHLQNKRYRHRASTENIHLPWMFWVFLTGLCLLLYVCVFSLGNVAMVWFSPSLFLDALPVVSCSLLSYERGDVCSWLNMTDKCKSSRHCWCTFTLLCFKYYFHYVLTFILCMYAF